MAVLKAETINWSAAGKRVRSAPALMAELSIEADAAEADATNEEMTDS